jgi:hypothetical protein
MNDQTTSKAMEAIKQLEKDRRDAIRLAGQLIAFISVNSISGTFKKATHEEVGYALDPFKDRLVLLQSRDARRVF